jgi:hypothetical protein
MNITFIIIIIIIIVLMYMIPSYSSYTYSTDCQLNSSIKSVIEYYKIKKVSKDGDFFFTSLYNACENTTLSLINSKSKYIGVMDGCDIVGSKVALWEILKNVYKNNAKEIMPQTYLYKNSNDMDELKKEIFNNIGSEKMYILKNHKQRQSGIKIVKSWDEINSYYNRNEFLLVQKYVYNPLIISNRKTNCRIYYLIVCKHKTKRLHGYIYHDGFMYYTPDFYDPNDTDTNKHITTGYIDRKVYDSNPLTLNDLRSYLGTTKSKIFDRNLQNIMKAVTYAISLYTCKNNKLYDKTLFQIYGVDIAPTDDLNVKIMEINKGPDLNAKDSRDLELKVSMQKEMIRVLLGNHNTTKFISVNP